MIQFVLFRLRTIRQTQSEIFEDSPPEVIRKIISNPAEISLRKNSRWNIGTPKVIDDNTYYFKFGKMTKETKGKFEDGDFVEEQEENARYTHVFLDGNLGVVAIAKKSSLSPETSSIAGKLAGYLNKCQFATVHNLTFEVKEIKDPSDFIEFIRSAYTITQFSFTYSKPNPFDAHKIIKQNEDYADAMNGVGRNTVSGRALNPVIVEEMSNSIAATGDDAHVVAIDKPNGVKKKRHLKKSNSATMQIQDESMEMKKDVIRLIRTLYNKIRNRDREE